MTIQQPDIIAKIRTAIDDIVPEAADSFTEDTDAELWQATQHAVWSLLENLPLSMMDQRTIYEDVTEGEADAQANVDSDGVGYIELPARFLRFVSLKMDGWSSQLYTLIEPGSDDQVRQRSAWGRGTPDKPKAMLDYHVVQNEETRTVTYSEKRVLRFWTAAVQSTTPTVTYKKSISEFNYIPTPVLTAATTGQNPTPATINCALRPETEKLVINQAAAIFFEGKKEPETAEKFRNM